MAWSSQQRTVEEQEELEKRAATPCFAIRLAMLRWVLANGKWRWLWETRAWIGLLTGDRIKCFRVSVRLERFWSSDDSRRYVMKYNGTHHRFVSKRKMTVGEGIVSVMNIS